MFLQMPWISSCDSSRCTGARPIGQACLQSPAGRATTQKCEKKKSAVPAKLMMWMQLSLQKSALLAILKCGFFGVGTEAVKYGNPCQQKKNPEKTSSFQPMLRTLPRRSSADKAMPTQLYWQRGYKCAYAKRQILFVSQFCPSFTLQDCDRVPVQHSQSPLVRILLPREQCFRC